VFNVTGIGGMKITIPNRNRTVDVTLNNILYSPDLAFTLISLSQCDKSGYSAMLKDKKCTISNPHGKLVGIVPMSNDGLYKVEHKWVMANAVKKLLIDEVHW
jgi:hypothetical protein